MVILGSYIQHYDAMVTPRPPIRGHIIKFLSANLKSVCLDNDYFDYMNEKYVVYILCFDVKIQHTRL